MGSEDINKGRFNFQIAYLLALIPDPKTRADITAEQIVLTDELKRKGDVYAAERAGFIVVSKIIDFLTSTFDLVHSDINGALSEYEINSDEVMMPQQPKEEVL
jgi:hypothetical protein